MVRTKLEITRRWFAVGAFAAALVTAGCVGVAAARPFSASGAAPAVAESTSCGTVANPCPDEWYLLLDGTMIVTRDIPAAPFSGGAPPQVGRGRPIEA